MQHNFKITYQNKVIYQSNFKNAIRLATSIARDKNLRISDVRIFTYNPINGKYEIR